jgi:hypothetical protein
MFESRLARRLGLLASFLLLRGCIILDTGPGKELALLAWPRPKHITTLEYNV